MSQTIAAKRFSVLELERIRTEYVGGRGHSDVTHRLAIELGRTPQSVKRIAGVLGVSARANPIHVALRGKPFEERFWALVNKTVRCWLWLGTRDSHGYGQIYRDDRRVLSHRVAWELTNGPIMGGLFACHRCDVPLCVNPAHLFLGSARDNIRDCVSKGRHRPGDQRGEKHSHAKLSAEQVRTIFRRARSGERHSALAREFGVWQSEIFRIVHRQRWSDVTDELAISAQGKDASEFVAIALSPGSLKECPVQPSQEGADVM